jgi:leucyl-tRNA synthetase
VERASAVSSEGLNDAERKVRRKTHETIRRVTADVEQRIHLNTAVSGLMELVNDLYGFAETLQNDGRPQSYAVLREAVEALVVMLSPFAPHTAEELWERIGHPEGLAGTKWPSFDEQVAKPEEIVVPIQVNGKLRSRLTVPAETSESEMRERALADPAIKTYTAGKTIKAVVVAKGRLINVVVE